MVWAPALCLCPSHGLWPCGVCDGVAPPAKGVRGCNPEIIWIFFFLNPAFSCHERQKVGLCWRAKLHVLWNAKKLVLHWRRLVSRKPDKHAGNSIQCYKFCTIQRKIFQHWEFGKGVCPPAPLPTPLMVWKVQTSTYPLLDDRWRDRKSRARGGSWEARSADWLNLNQNWDTYHLKATYFRQARQQKARSK